MKTILLLVFAVLVSSSPAEHRDKYLLGELVVELDKTVKMFSKEDQENKIYLTELQMNGCKREVFCQAEQELIKKVSGLSGAEFDHFRVDKKLMRNLNMYNKRHVKTCKHADEGQDEIVLRAFLKNLLTCVKSAYSQDNIPAKLSKMTSLAKLDDELDTSMKTVSKETEGGKHLTKRCNKTLPGELDDKLDKALKNVPKEAKEKEIFLTKKLLMDGCKAFCQAEQELIKKVSGLSGAKFGHFCIDKKLMRNLNMHNKRHVQRHVGPHSGSSGEDME